MESAFPRVLVVDDEDAIRELLVYGLARQGFEVRAAPDGPSALTLMGGWSPEVIVLDVTLPGVDGLAMLPAFRRISEVPIIMLTARSATADKVAAFTIGADDYVAKPFEMEELVARLRAVLRRPRLQQRETIGYADLSINVGRRTVTRGSRRIALTTREFELLLTLGREPERIFTRAELLDLVWGAESDIAPATVETYISHLRAKIDAGDGPRLIHTMRGAGYALRRDGP
jgi:DNA-binding response OmpR family regulator